MWARGKAFFGMDGVLPIVDKEIVKEKSERNDSRCRRFSSDVPAVALWVIILS